MTYNDGFAWTPELVNQSNQLWAITAMIGAALCGAVLIVIGIVALNPVCRPHLDRVSFRILVWALAANTVFGITNAIGGKFTGPTWTCGFDIWLLQLTLELSSFLLFSIALNLQLVVVHQINGKKMERWYILGSIILSLVLTVPPYALKQYGWDPLVEDCWYSNDDPKQRLAWQIGTQLFWSLLGVAGEIICTSIVVIYMVRHQLRAQKRIVVGSGSRIATGTRSRSGPVVALKSQVTHANAYRGIILRIIAYPVASAIFNLISAICVIHATQNDGVHNWTGYRVLLLSDFVYGGRSILYALLAATDPALVRALRAFIHHSRHGGTYPSSASGGQSTSFRGATDSKGGTLSVHIELSTIYQNDDGQVVDHDPEQAKYPTSSPGDGYPDKFDSLKAADINAIPRSDIVPVSTIEERTQIRRQEERAHRLEEERSFKQSRHEFWRQI